MSGLNGKADTVIDVAKRIVDQSNNADTYEEAVAFAAKEIQSVAKDAILETLSTVGTGVTDMVSGMKQITELLLPGK
jgi:hypothetical protein